jgi:2-polyprenyl-6-methoxyphenol hydroxylase-like FAD-dependent oxidoreductase
VPGTPSFVAISRGALAGILGDALAAPPGASIRYGTTLTALRDRGDAVEVDLRDPARWPPSSCRSPGTAAGPC